MHCHSQIYHALFWEILLFSHCFLRWIEACIHEELPPTIELEEALRNGVICAKLANFFAPEIAPVRKIFDKDLTRYRVCSFLLLIVIVIPHQRDVVDELTVTVSWCILIIHFKINHCFSLDHKNILRTREFMYCETLLEQGFDIFLRKEGCTFAILTISCIWFVQWSTLVFLL